ncbi:helix-turn-helix domain-containing protein [Robertkochia solimangrovi]|uniref:helix-turn-helix domain-containing protein n=1 Tax=Robertkochia solimangrovi TaxID=2213046 RepID=UPI00117C2398|nr:helix-turn-helix domain-containing protein [Robertkochia solimangrovi]TRZ46325.1 AraC family transcriptional regulator [Robertkochia solimangrovi]
MQQLFKIFKFTTEDAKALEGKEIIPHEHDFEELIVGVEGKVSHFIDFGDATIYAPFVSFVTQGKIHRLHPQTHNGICNFWVIRFRSEFISESLFRLYAFFHNRANISLASKRCFTRYSTLCDMMFDEYRQERPDLAILKQLLTTLITMLYGESSMSDNDEKQLSANMETYANFLLILEDNYKRAEKVSFYAEKLFMTERNLNRICQEVIHQSVSEIIENRKLTEAKNLLIGTSRTVAEIGYELGYNEKAYFSKVFKRRTGQTPTEFRREMKKLIS